MLQNEDLMVSEEPEGESPEGDALTLPLPRRRKGTVVKKEPRVNISQIASLADIPIDTVTVLTSEQQQQLLDQQPSQQQTLTLGDTPQHIVAEFPREFTLTLEKVTLDKMASQGLLVDHLPKLSQPHSEELQVVGTITSPVSGKQVNMQKHLEESLSEFEKPSMKLPHSGTALLQVNSSPLETLQTSPSMHRLEQLLEINQHSGNQGVNLHLQNGNLPASQTIIVSQAPAPSVITNPLLHLAEVMSGQHPTVVTSNTSSPMTINYASLHQFQPFVTTGTQQPTSQTNQSPFVQNFQHS